MRQGVSYWRMIWPESGPLLAGVGGIIGLLSDVGGFLGGITSPWVWGPVVLGLLLAVLLFAPCRRRVLADLPKKQDEAYDCRICNVFRVGLFACLVCAMLALAGQGATATGNIGEKLGLIERKVDDIKQDTALIRDDASAMREVLAVGELVKKPKSAAERFHNAWLLNMQRGDNAGAWAQLQALYNDYTPNKLDAAELYRNVGKAFLGRDELLARMVEIGRLKRDAAMLIIAARNEADPDVAQALRAEARAIDPDLPFAYWDVGDFSRQFGGAGQAGNAAQQLAHYRAVVAGHEKFLEVAARGPVARYFYRPQFQADYDDLARSQLQNARSMVESWEKMDSYQRPRRGQSYEETTRRMQALADGGAADLVRRQMQKRKKRRE